jgi:hypothetical protein
MQTIKANVTALCNVTEDNAKKFIKWVWAFRHKNNFDMQVMTYPRTVMFTAENESGPLAFLPAQPVLMFESLAPKPGLTNKQTAMSLWRIGEVAADVMKDTGLRESYFITNDQDEADSCEKHGWTKLLHDSDKGQWLMKRRVVPTGE